MIVFRFTPEQYSDDISGEGSRLYGGRWNSKGLPVVYTSFTISLSLLEILVYSASYEQLNNNFLVRIEVPDTGISVISENSLRRNWQSDPDYSQYMGDEFLTQKNSLLLKVPSAIIPEENNIMINPLHPDFNKVKINSAKKFGFDGRLFK
jgi:RES domain-containing protein